MPSMSDGISFHYLSQQEEHKRIKSVKGGMDMAKNLLEQIIEEEVAIELEEAKAELKAQIYDEVRAECMAKWYAEGRAEGRESFLRILLNESSPTEISRKYGIPLEEVNSVAGSMMA